jgi:sugar lactone lactonase YvrE
MALSPDTKTVMAETNGTTVRVWDLRTGKQLHEHRVDLHNGTSTLALSGDGVLVAVANMKMSQGMVALHERETGRLVRTIDTGAGSLVVNFAFAPEGRLLAISGVETGPRGRGDRRPFLALWDAESGRELRRLPGAERGKPCFSPDGRLLAVRGGDQVRLWEVATGHERQLGRGRETIPQPRGRPYAHAFSPDGRTLALADPKGVTLWELAAGKERGRIEVPLQHARSLAFSPDGRWLACDSDRAVVLCDVRSGQIIHTFNGHAGEVQGLAFAPDGRTLVSCSFDTTLLVWDVASVVARQAKPRPQPNAAAVAAAWTDLASTDAQTAYRSIDILASAPGLSLPLLRDRVQPDRAADGKQVERWLTQLDGEDFEERQKATRELVRLGEQAEAPLRRFLATDPPLEARKRAEELLDRLTLPLTDLEWLRKLRAVETLERIGTAEARQVLRALSEGAAASRLTGDAKASLDRLAHRPGVR